MQYNVLLNLTIIYYNILYYKGYLSKFYIVLLMLYILHQTEYKTKSCVVT
jgi:hypothetical protein